MPVTTSRLVGRQQELRVLQDALERGARCGTSLVIIGEAGIGKTALLAVTRSMAREAGFRVLSTIGVEAEAQLPFAGLHQVLHDVLDRCEELPNTQREALLSAFGLFDGPRPELFLIAQAALALLTLIAEDQPVAVLADDVHWLDPQTHEILTFLAHRSETARLAVLGAARTGHSGSFVVAGFPELVVRGVNDLAAREILLTHARPLSSADRIRIQQLARGNPLALLELPATWREGSDTDRQPPPLSTHLERAFAVRTGELPGSTRDALLVAAADYADDLAEVLKATAALNGSTATSEVFLPAVRAGLIAIAGQQLQFRHPLVRSAVLQAETLVRRQAAHAALAHVLRDDPYRGTWHRAQSIVGPDDQIADDLEATVADSLRRGAVMTAVSSLRRSAELTSSSAQRGHRLLVAAEHAFSLGRADVVDQLVQEAARTDLNELDWARMQWLQEIFNDGVPGNAYRVLELCEIARRAVAADPDLALNLLLGAALRCWWADSGPGPRGRVVAILDGMPQAQHDARYVAALAVAEPVLRGAETLERLARVDTHAVHDADALRLYGMAAHAVGDTVQATDFLERAEQRLRDDGRLGLLPHVLGMQVNIRLELGDWDGSAAAAEEVYRLSRETGQPLWTIGNITCDARARALRGDWQRALELVAQAEMEANRQRLNDTLCLAQMARGAALLSAGRYGEAYAALRGQFEPVDPSYHQREGFASLTFLAEAAVHCNEQRDARDVVARLEQIAAVTPSPILRVHLGYARAVLADPVAAEALFAEALTDDLSRWPWARARLELAYGTWLNRNGRRTEAWRYLTAARRTFERIGAIAWLRSASAEMDAPRTTPVGLFDTP